MPSEPATISARDRPSASHATDHRTPGILFAVGIGGAVGGSIRYEIQLAWPGRPGTFPWSTLLVNLSGALLLGLLATLVIEHWPPSRYLRAFAGVGLCGGYTTWSTFMTETTVLAKDGHRELALLYLALSLIAGLAATGAGILLGRLWPIAPVPESPGEPGPGLGSDGVADPRITPGPQGEPGLR